MKLYKIRICIKRDFQVFTFIQKKQEMNYMKSGFLHNHLEIISIHAILIKHSQISIKHNQNSIKRNELQM